MFQGVVGDDEFRVAVFGTFIITNLVYWTVGGIYSYFDITGTPEFLKKYKVCNTKNMYAQQGNLFTRER
jgi:hypothetical protein